MDLHPDFKDLLAEFARSKVSYAILGGYAVGYYAKPRATKDLDLLLSGADDNLARAATALAVFGAPANVVESVRALKPTEIAYLGTEPVRVDLLRSADGIETESVIARAKLVVLDGLSVSLIALDDLIANKRASARPQDLADVAALERFATKV
jgi:predicted nucleotidyltransferase